MSFQRKLESSIFKDFMDSRLHGNDSFLKLSAPEPSQEGSLGCFPLLVMGLGMSEAHAEKGIKGWVKKVKKGYLQLLISKL